MILVTGSNGLIGSFICNRLAELNIKFRALVRGESDLRLLNGIEKSGNLFVADVLDPVALEEAFVGVTKVVHCAAIISFFSKDQKRMYKVNIEGTRNLVDLSLKYNVQKFVYISSIAAIGKDKGDKVIDENNKWPGSVTPSNYGRSKYLAELEVWRANTEGLPVGVLAPSVVLGPGDWNKGSTKAFKYVWEKNRFYNSGSLNFVDVRDLTNSVINLLNSSEHSERFIINGGNTTWKSFFEKVAASMHLSPPSIVATPFLITIALIFDKLLSFFPGVEQKLSKEAIAQSKNDFIYSSEKIKKIYGQEFNGLDDTVHWVCSKLISNNIGPNGVGLSD